MSKRCEGWIKSALFKQWDDASGDMPQTWLGTASYADAQTADLDPNKRLMVRNIRRVNAGIIFRNVVLL